MNEVSQISYASALAARTRLGQKVPLLDRPGEFLPIRGYYDLNPVGKRHWSNLEFVEHVAEGVPLTPRRGRQQSVLVSVGTVEAARPIGNKFHTRMLQPRWGEDPVSLSSVVPLVFTRASSAFTSSSVCWQKPQPEFQNS
ncbi:MAG: hypothetical protein JOZ17_00345 [Acetobacteraceae bacterium]|nr:hypothetical protein [Acetobacteraceae bacterium]